MSKGPQFIRFMHPILVSLKENGGSATLGNGGQRDQNVSQFPITNWKSR